VRSKFSYVRSSHDLCALQLRGNIGEVYKKTIIEARNIEALSGNRPANGP